MFHVCPVRRPERTRPARWNRFGGAAPAVERKDGMSRPPTLPAPRGALRCTRSSRPARPRRPQQQS
eukprot:108773-Pyramimonas_sp.AAC.1